MQIGPSDARDRKSTEKFDIDKHNQVVYIAINVQDTFLYIYTQHIIFIIQTFIPVHRYRYLIVNIYTCEHNHIEPYLLYIYIRIYIVIHVLFARNHIHSCTQRSRGIHNRTHLINIDGYIYIYFHLHHTTLATLVIHPVFIIYIIYIYM